VQHAEPAVGAQGAAAAQGDAGRSTSRVVNTAAGCAPGVQLGSQPTRVPDASVHGAGSSHVQPVPQRVDAQTDQAPGEQPWAPMLGFLGSRLTVKVHQVRSAANNSQMQAYSSGSGVKGLWFSDGCRPSGHSSELSAYMCALPMPSRNSCMRR
jgi:hypothetical protein